MEKYNRIIQELRVLFPHCKDVRIEIDTDSQDIKTFSEDIKEVSKTSFFIQTGTPLPENYTAYRSNLGMIKLNKI